MRKLFAGEMPVIPDRIGIVMQSLITRCWSLNSEDRPSFDAILEELRGNDFTVFPGASSRKVFEYVRSVLDWEMCNLKSKAVTE
jgi:hypothetical protein